MGMCRRYRASAGWIHHAPVGPIHRDRLDTVSTPAPRSQDEPATAKRAAVQEAVLTATEELINEGATYADLNIEKIATRAGISRTAFYFYFADKRELLMRMSADVNELMFQQASAWWQGSGEDPDGELREALGAISKIYREHDALLRVIVEVSTYEQATGDYWRGLMKRFTDAVEDRIAIEQAAGRALPGPAAKLAFVLVWATERSLYQAYINDGNDPEGAVEALAILFRRTIYGGP
jgi:TetR/AcrR family transcriptional regulator, ethionamide resistance regulator